MTARSIVVIALALAGGNAEGAAKGTPTATPTATPAPAPKTASVFVENRASEKCVIEARLDEIAEAKLTAGESFTFSDVTVGRHVLHIEHGTCPASGGGTVELDVKADGCRIWLDFDALTVTGKELGGDLSGSKCIGAKRGQYR